MALAPPWLRHQSSGHLSAQEIYDLKGGPGTSRSDPRPPSARPEKETKHITTATHCPPTATRTLRVATRPQGYVLQMSMKFIEIRSSY